MCLSSSLSLGVVVVVAVVICSSAVVKINFQAIKTRTTINNLNINIAHANETQAQSKRMSTAKIATPAHRTKKRQNKRRKKENNKIKIVNHIKIFTPSHIMSLAKYRTENWLPHARMVQYNSSQSSQSANTLSRARSRSHTYKHNKYILRSVWFMRSFGSLPSKSSSSSSSLLLLSPFVSIAWIGHMFHFELNEREKKTKTKWNTSMDLDGMHNAHRQATMNAQPSDDDTISSWWRSFNVVVIYF